MDKRIIKNLVLIHGRRGQAPWMEWVREELCRQKIDISISAPLLTGQGGNYEDWKSEFERQGCGKYVNENSLFVGHSLGSQFVIKYLNEKQKEIAGYISIAAPRNIAVVTSDDLTRRKTFRELAETQGFGLSEIDCEKIRGAAFPKISIYSADGSDETFDVENMKKYADAIGAKHVRVQNEGHFRGKVYPVILESIKDMIGVSVGGCT